MSDHECQKEEIIEEIRSRLGRGDVTLATLDLKLDQIKEQTTKTNGRVTKLEDVTAGMKYTWKMVIRDVVVAFGTIGGLSATLIGIYGK
ncbi:MAG TPA: hypothetical protein PKI68_01015 [Pontiellaceae bacterium]|nr:hypothetical protein [Pontiellaceae bacterium]